MTLRAVVFDFDGLICDTEGPDFQTWSETFDEHGVELPRDWWNQLIGTADGPSPHELLVDLVGAIDVESVRSKRLERYLELVDASPLCDGVLDWLDDARKARFSIGLATSTTIWIDRNLARLGIADRFDCIRTRDDVEAAKPSPDVYLAALRGLGVGPAEAFAVEDSPNGIRAARAAGMKCVAVPNPLTAALEFDSPDVVLSSFAASTFSDVLVRLR